MIALPLEPYLLGLQVFGVDPRTTGRGPDQAPTLVLEPARKGSEMSERINAVVNQLRKGRPTYQKCFTVRQGAVNSCCTRRQQHSVRSVPCHCFMHSCYSNIRIVVAHLLCSPNLISTQVSGISSEIMPVPCLCCCLPSRAVIVGRAQGYL